MPRKVKTLGAALGRTNQPIHDGLSDFVAGLARSSLQNARLGIGTGVDKRLYTDYGFQANQTRQQLENIFQFSWLGCRIITTLTDEMVRNWRTISWGGSGDGDTGLDEVLKAEEALCVKEKLTEASYWARLYGGCLIIPILRGMEDMDPEELRTPLVLDTIGQGDLLGFQVIDRWRCSYDGQWDYNMTSPHFGRPIYYLLAESGVRLHWTRTIRLDGRKIPYYPFRRNGMWHDSVLQNVIVSMKNYDTATAGLATMFFEANIDVIKQGGLAKALTTKDGTARVTSRFQQAMEMKGSSRFLILDKDTEEYSRNAYTFSGLDKAYEKLMSDMAGAADVPLTKLFGESPGGMNSTGKGEEENFNRHVAARQVTHLSPPLKQMDGFLVRSVLGYMPDDYKSTWKPVAEESNFEKSQRELTDAQKDKTYFDIGIGDEVMFAKELKARGVYPNLTDEDINKMAAALKDREKQEADMAKAQVAGKVPLPGNSVPPGDDSKKNLNSPKKDL